MPIDGEASVRSRRLSGFWGILEKIVCILIPVIAVLFILGVHEYFRIAIYKEQYLAVFLGLVLTGIFIGVPANKKPGKNKLQWYDIALAVVGLGISLYYCKIYPEYIMMGISAMGQEFVVLGFILIVLVAEATRRTTDKVLVIMLVVFLLYALLSSSFPGPFAGKSIRFDQLMKYITLDTSSLLGLPLWVTGSIVFGFIIFGEFLLATGGSNLINNFAMSVMGRYRGGPAKVAIVGSSLFGTISGSTVANVAAVGVVTIPMMKKAGYKSHVAAAIEAVASTGGQIMPPVMGITAFLIAEFLQIPYKDVAIAALAPALLYYIILFIQVDLEAGKGGLKGLKSDVPRLIPILKKAWIFFLPALILIYFLFFMNYEPGKASIYATISIIIFGLATKETRIGLFKLVKVLEGCGRGLLMMGAISGIAGLVIGVIYVTGVGTSLTNFLLAFGSNNLFLVLIITAALCIVMGMGMPTAAIYVILAVLVAPALIKLGIVPISAHLFLFYMGTSSFITPPVALAAFAAGAIANASPLKVGVQACRLGVVAFIVPFLFVYSPAILLRGDIIAIVLIMSTSLIGLISLAVALSGFLFVTLNWPTRILFAVAGFGLIMPAESFSSSLIWANIAGLVLLAVLTIIELMKRKRIPEGSLSTPPSQDIDNLELRK